MPNWDGIEDVSPNPLRVWLARSKESEPWKPLRKADCWALNESQESTVVIDGGRWTADKEEGIVTSNFHKAPVKTLNSAIWFIRKEPPSKDAKKHEILQPIFNKEDTLKMESLYQEAIEASSLYGKGLDELCQSHMELEDGSKIKVIKSGNVLSIKLQPPGWLTARQDLQRGYGVYNVDGEDTELMLGPVKHLYFVVHGIGESIWSREDTSMSSLVEDVGNTRMNIQTRQVESWKKQCEKNKKEGLPVPPMPDRVEFIPIEWYDRIHGSSNALSRSLQRCTLPTIPALRGIANEAVFDVLMYLTPTFCQDVLDTVHAQISQNYLKFLEIHPHFLAEGGKCSLIGHSLGSVICWDLLAILKDKKKSTTIPGPEALAIQGRQSPGGVHVGQSVDVGYQAYAQEDNADKAAENGAWGPTLPTAMEKTLPFVPENAIFLGSPLGMFLTLRGAHPVFDELRQEKDKAIREEFQSQIEKLEAQITSTEVMRIEDSERVGELPPKQEEKKDKNKDDNKKAEKKEDKQLPELPFASTFTLPVGGGVYNIFHPSDPVAYRIEPLLLPPDMEEKEVPPPVHLTLEGEGVRFHIKATEIGGEIAKLVDESGRGFSNLLNRAIKSLGQSTRFEEVVEDAAARSLEQKEPKMGPKVFPLGGKSKRVDFQLQRNVVDPEYLSAVTAHSTYFVNTDVQDFVMSLAAKASAPAPAGSASKTDNPQPVEPLVVTMR